AIATAESIRQVNDAIAAGGESYFRYKQIEMLPQIAPTIARALAQAKLVTITSGVEGGEGAATTATNNITSVIQTVLAAQLVSRSGLLESAEKPEASNGAPVPPPPAVRR